MPKTAGAASVLAVIVALLASPWPGGSVGAPSVDQVEDRLHLHVVVGLLRRDAVRVDVHLVRRQRIGSVALRQRGGEIHTVDGPALRDVGVDLRREEVVDALPGRTVHQVVGGVLVRPGRPAAGGLHHLEDRVHLEEAVRRERMAAAAVLRQREISRIHASAEESRQIEVDRLVVDHFRARCPGAVAARRVERAIIAVVVVDPGALRRAAGHEREQAGERVRGRGGARVGVDDAAPAELCERRRRMARDPPRQVRLVQAVDAEEQNVLHSIPLIRGGWAYRKAQCEQRHCTRETDPRPFHGSSFKGSADPTALRATAGATRR